MQASVGMPVLMLDRQGHFGDKPDSKHGNLRAVICEAMSERECSDPDLNRELTQYNEYWAIDDMGLRDANSGVAWADKYEEMADEYRVIDKNGKAKRLRSDANIAFAGIIKPDMEFMQTLSEEEQFTFLSDSLDCVRKIYEKRGMKINMSVVHVDEGNPHVHYFGYDPEYKMSDKLKMPFYRALNVTEYPKMMQARGWDVKELTGYLEATQGMSESEKEEYKAKKRADRKAGKTSKAYKTEKAAANKLKEAEELERSVQKRQTGLIRAKKQAMAEIQAERDKMRSEASQSLTEAYEQAEQIKRQAMAEAEAIKKQAYEQARRQAMTEYMALPEQTKRYAKQWEKHLQTRENLDSVGQTDNKGRGYEFGF